MNRLILLQKKYPLIGNENIGRNYLVKKLCLTYNCNSRLCGLFDFVSFENPSEIWEIKTKQIKDYYDDGHRPFAIDFRREQIEYFRKHKSKSLRVLLVLCYPNNSYDIRLLSLRDDFIGWDRKLVGETIRLSLKHDKRDYCREKLS